MSSCTLSPGYAHLKAYTDRNAALCKNGGVLAVQMHDALRFFKNNGSNGSIFSISSEVSNSSTQNVRQIETTRSGKDEANKALQDLASTAENSHSNLMLHITRTGSSLPGNHQQQRHHRSFPRDSCAYKSTNDGLHPG